MALVLLTVPFTSVRVLVLGQACPVGRAVYNHAVSEGCVMANDGDVSKVDLIIGCQTEFCVAELRRAQRHTAPSLATMICLTNRPPECEQVLGPIWERKMFAQFRSDVYMPHFATLTEANREGVARHVLDASLQMLHDLE